MTALAVKVAGWLITASLALALVWHHPDASEGIVEPVFMTLAPYEQPIQTIQPIQPRPTTTLPADICQTYVDQFVFYGLPLEQADTAYKIMKRESRCQPDAHNPFDSNGGSYGLMQINGYWCKPTKYWPTGYLQAQGTIRTCLDLFDPSANLRSALLIYKAHNDWSPWKATSQ